MKAIIVDMDGTLANCTHRLHYVNSKPKNYDAFEAECHKDEPYEAVKMVVNCIGGSFPPKDRVHVLIVSARQGNREQATKDWLKKHCIYFDKIYMRTDKDYRRDDIVKRELLDKIRADGYTEILFAIDDRKRVKQMWVSEGIFVFDVNQKDKEY